MCGGGGGGGGGGAVGGGGGKVGCEAINKKSAFSCLILELSICPYL